MPKAYSEDIPSLRGNTVSRVTAVIPALTMLGAY
jgi:hypothetical protein